MSRTNKAYDGLRVVSVLIGAEGLIVQQGDNPLLSDSIGSTYPGLSTLLEATSIADNLRYQARQFAVLTFDLNISNSDVASRLASYLRAL